MVKTRTVSLDSGDNIVMKITARTITLTTCADAIEVIDDGKITALEYSKDLKYEIEKTIKVDKQLYKILEIEKQPDDRNSNIKSYTLYIHMLTKSAIFIMPFLGYDRDYFKWNSVFCNCFIGTENEGTYGDRVYLLYRFSGQAWFAAFEQLIKSKHNCINAIDVDSAHVLFEFSFPEEYEEDKELILEGKYSKISQKAKDRLISFHNSSRDKPLYQILYKSPKRRKQMEQQLSVDTPVFIKEDAELFDKFEPEKEIYLNKYKVDEPEKQNNKRFGSDSCAQKI